MKNAWSRTVARSLATTSVLALAIAGCQVGTQSPTNSTGNAAQGNVANGSLLKPGQNANSNTSTNAAANPGPTRDQVLSSAQPMAVTAATGGSYVSPDGNLKVTIPPGALTKDATVRFAAADSSVIPSNADQTPLVRFAADLGGAAVADGQKITVSAKVDSRFIAWAKANVPGFSPDQAGMTQDQNGNYYMAMPISGDNAPAANEPTGTNWSLYENGPNYGNSGVSATTTAAAGTTHFDVLNATPSPSPSADPSASPTPAPTPTPTPTPTPVPTLPPIDAGHGHYGNQINGMPAMPVPDAGNYQTVTQAAWWDGREVPLVRNGISGGGAGGALDINPDADTVISQTVSGTEGAYGEFFQCLMYAHTNCLKTQVDTVLTDIELYNQAIKHNRQPPQSLVDEVQGYTSSTNCSTNGLAPVHVTLAFDSDDPRAVSQITNGTVVFGSGSATWTVTNNVNGTYSQPEGNGGLTITGSVPNPNGLAFGLAGDANSAQANPLVSSMNINVNQPSTQSTTITWHKHSPLVTLTLQAPVPIVNPVVTYTASNGGTTATYTMPGYNNDINQNVTFASDSGTGTTRTISFYVPVSDDGTNHTIVVKGVQADNSVGSLGQPITFNSVQRTRAYTPSGPMQMDAIIAK